MRSSRCVCWTFTCTRACSGRPPLSLLPMLSHLKVHHLDKYTISFSASCPPRACLVRCDVYLRMCMRMRVFVLLLACGKRKHHASREHTSGMRILP